jgi:hypothetical protein
LSNKMLQIEQQRECLRWGSFITARMQAQDVSKMHK